MEIVEERQLEDEYVTQWCFQHRKRHRRSFPCRQLAWMRAVVIASAATVVVMMITEEDTGKFLSPFGATTIQNKHRGHDSEHGNRYFCEYLMNNRKQQQTTETLSVLPPLQYHDMDCGNDYGSSRLGNYLMRWYLTRSIAARANVTLSGSCHSNKVLQWIPQQHLLPGDVVNDIDAVTAVHAAWQDTCALCLSNVTKISDMCVFPHGVHIDVTATAPAINMASMVPTIQRDMQGLLHAVLERHPQLHFELDDVAIHMRLGDIGSIASSKYGLVPFSVYAKYIDEIILPSSKENFTIGLVTAPFFQQRGRRRPNNPYFNQAVVEAVRDFLKSKYSQATITVRNSAKDTHDVVFARLLGANELLLCAPSSYCLVPALGRRSPQNSVMIQSKLFGSLSNSTGWLGIVQKKSDSTFRYMKESMITSTRLQQMSTNEVVQALSSPSDDGRALISQ
jgi:hypothetical protein